MSQEYTLSAEQSSRFHEDEFRIKLRSELSSQFPEGVKVLTPDGDLIDTIGALNPEEIELAAIVDEHAAEEKAKLRELELQEIDRMENVIRPQVISKLKVEVRGEFREQIRNLTNEKLSLNATIAKLQRDGASSTAIIRRKLEEKESELETLKVAHSDTLRNFVALNDELSRSQHRVAELESLLENKTAPESESDEN